MKSRIRLDRKFRHPSEGKAVLFLESIGHTLLAHNYHVGFLEFDLVTKDKTDAIHCIEVKDWNHNLTHPLERISAKRVGMIKKAMEILLQDLTLSRETRIDFMLLQRNGDSFEVYANLLSDYV